MTNELPSPLPIGTKTHVGTISGIRFADGERYYFLVDDEGGVAFLPDDVVRGIVK